MVPNFDPRSAKVLPSTEEGCGKDAECKYCVALRLAQEQELFDPLPELCSPMSPGVQRINLSHSDDGQMLRVNLGGDWNRMFEQLPTLGAGLVMTRNEAVILGRRMAFPELAFTTHGTKGASWQGGLWFDFRALGAARAVHLRCESGHIFGIEFADKVGHMIHRFTATRESNLELFLGWVRLHQACSGNNGEWLQIEEDEASTAGHTVDGAGSANAILSILDACCVNRLGVRATIHTSGVVQRAQFIPQALRAAGDWWFAHDDLVGLHFCAAQFTHAKTATQPNGRGPRLLLYGRKTVEQPALVLESVDERRASTWSKLLHLAGFREASPRML
jgi:hypothetical protein